MKSLAASFIGFTCVITGIAGMQTVIVSLSYFGKGSMLRLNTLVWAACAASFFALNNILRRKSVLLPRLVLANATLFGLSLFVIIMTAHELSGFWGYLITVVLALITAVISFRYSDKTQTQSSQLIIFDMYIVLMFWEFLLISSGMPGDDLPFHLFVLLLNVICNLAVRSREHNMSSTLRLHIVRGIVFYIGLLAVMSALVFGLVRLFSSASAYAVTAFFNTLGNGLRYMLSLPERFFDWFFSLFTYSHKDISTPVTDAGTAGPEISIEQFRIRPEILYAVVTILALVAVVVFVLVVYRFRKKRLYGSHTPKSTQK